MKLWQKTPAQSLHPLIQEYTVGDDPQIDLILMPYDIEASRAHARGLQRIGILTEEECTSLIHGLDTLLQQWRNGAVTITADDEDMHTVIERFLTEQCGDAGKKIHTGRSRNDQVLTALRLYMKQQLNHMSSSAHNLAEAFLRKAEQYGDIPLPGYSHTQQAMLTNIGHYYGSSAESLLDDIEFLGAIHHHIDKNPLGSAAGFGTSLPIDRDYTTKELGFEALQINSLYCQNSRGKFESVFLEGCVQLMMTLGKYANDMLLFTSREFAFFAVDDGLVTGSSIMPQKRNLDGLEILRAHVSRVIANQHLVQDIAKGTMSGYHRDYQHLKKPVLESADIVLRSISIAMLYLEGLTPIQENINARICRDIFMADIANDLVQKEGIPFRDAYMHAAAMHGNATGAQENIHARISFGGSGNTGIRHLQARLGQSESTN